MVVYKKILKAGSILMFSKVISGAFAITSMILIASKLTVASFGLFSLTITFILLNSIFLDFGLTNVLIKSRNKTEYSKNVFLINGLISRIYIFPLILLITYFIAVYAKLPIILPIIVIGLFKFLVEVKSAYLLISEKYIFLSIFQILGSSTIYVIALYAIYVQENYDINNIYMNFTYFSMFISLYLLYDLISSAIKSYKISFLIQKIILKQSFSFGLFTIGGLAYTSTDVMMLSNLQDKVSVGIYQAAYRLVMAFDMIFSMLSKVAFPIFSKELIENKRKNVKSTSNKLIFNGIIFSLIIMIVVTIFAKPIILYLYGNLYIITATLLPILFDIIPMRVFNHMYGIILSSYKDHSYQLYRTKIVLFAFLLNIILNYILIPRYNYYGAALSTIFTTILVLVGYHLKIKKANL
jgi:O-antigen/teichoic acid export membrane protein